MSTRARDIEPITGRASGSDLGGAACSASGCDATGSPDASVSLGGMGIRLGIGFLVVGQSMVFGLALNSHDDVPPQARAITQWLILAGTALVAVLLGGPLARAAWEELRRGRLTIEALFLLTMVGASAASLQAHLTGRGKIYFEVVSVLLVVYTLGKLIGDRTRAVALARARAWGDQLQTCRLVDETGAPRTAPVIDVTPGDVVEVWPGETIAVDGVIRAGVGFVSESAVSGEPFAVVRKPGDRVLAGSASFDATFRIAATVKGTERQVDHLLATVEAARTAPLSLQARADAIGRWFLPAVAVTALGTFLYWTFETDAGWAPALFYAMSVLLVACPCVIGLATPVVIWSALARLAERGVIVRLGDAIERLATVDRVLFDKTGTLTEDRFALVSLETAPGTDRVALLGWLALVQERSRHPIAKPFADLPRHLAPGTKPRVVALVAVPGCGVRAELEHATGVRHRIEIGTPEWLPGLSSGWHRPAAPAAHRVHIALDGVLVAVATVSERLRDSAPQALAHLTRLGLSVEVLTGDARGRAEALGLPVARAGLLPNDKRAAVEAARAAGAKPLFVGDGINDASALACAHVGVALASGTELAVGAAPVTLHSDDLRVLPWAIEVSRDAVRAVRRNLFRALAYNLVGMALAACGVLHPVVAAVLMVVSSLTLIFSSTRVGQARCATAPDEPGFSVAPLGVEVGPTSATRGAEEKDEKAGPTSAPRGAEEKAEHTIPKKPAPIRLALVHALAFALQGCVFLLLLAPLREPRVAVSILGAFALVGIVLAVVWRRFAVPHWLDMCFGMLTLGNLGMLLGGWADNGFVPLYNRGCCACVEAMRDGVMRPWMWVGMLALSNGAMIWFGRSPAPPGCHRRAMCTGGNAGMVLGMIAGGWCAAQFGTETMTLAVASSFAGMTIGMLVGMLAGTWLAERLFAGLRALGLVPRWHRFTSSRTV